MYTKKWSEILHNKIRIWSFFFWLLRDILLNSETIVVDWLEDENWFFADGIGHFQTYLTNLARLQALHVVIPHFAVTPQNVLTPNTIYFFITLWYPYSKHCKHCLKYGYVLINYKSFFEAQGGVSICIKFQRKYGDRMVG